MSDRDVSGIGKETETGGGNWIEFRRARLKQWCTPRSKSLSSRLFFGAFRRHPLHQGFLQLHVFIGKIMVQSAKWPIIIQ